MLGEVQSLRRPLAIFGTSTGAQFVTIEGTTDCFRYYDHPDSWLALSHHTYYANAEMGASCNEGEREQLIRRVERCRPLSYAPSSRRHARCLTGASLVVAVASPLWGVWDLMQVMTAQTEPNVSRRFISAACQPSCLHRRNHRHAPHAVRARSSRPGLMGGHRSYGASEQWRAPNSSAYPARRRVA
jgi:hypothetical protein